MPITTASSVVLNSPFFIRNSVRQDEPVSQKMNGYLLPTILETAFINFSVFSIASSTSLFS